MSRGWLLVSDMTQKKTDRQSARVLWGLKLQDSPPQNLETGV